MRSATVFYPEATDEACTAAVLLDVDPVGMVRGRGSKGAAAAMLSAAENATRSPETGDLELQIAMVAGRATDDTDSPFRGGGVKPEPPAASGTAYRFTISCCGSPTAAQHLIRRLAGAAAWQTASVLSTLDQH